MSLDLTVTIVNFNAGKLILECLESLYKNTKGLSFEVIVSDNGSTDGSLEKLEKKFPQVKVVRNNANLGFGGGMNQGIKRNQGRYFLALNPDTQLFPGTLKKMVEFMDKNPKVGLLGPQIYTFKNELQESAYQFPTVRQAFKGSYFLYPGFDYSRAGQTDWLEGSCLMIRKEALRPFDDNYLLYFEETDLCYQLKKEGWQVTYFPGARILHHVGEGGSKNIDKEKTRYRSLKYFFNKNYGVLPTAFNKLIGLTEFLLWTTAMSPKMLQGRKDVKDRFARYREKVSKTF